MVKAIFITLGSVALIFLVVWGYLWHTLREEVRPLSEEEAIEKVMAAYPELTNFEASALPPHEILAEADGLAWQLGFIEWGSGVPGILSARCFSVSRDTVEARGTYMRSGTDEVAAIDLISCRPIGVDIEETEIHAFGTVTIALGELAQFSGMSIRPLAIIEDSRCPRDVQCIQAGTVRVKLETVSGMGTSTDTIALRGELTTEVERIVFEEVMPDTLSTREINDEDYRLTFSVSKRPADVVNPPIGGEPKPTGGCYIGGCSSQICSDEPNVASTCEFRESYACYAKTSVCERQANGQCGWTKTPALTQCLLNAA